MVRKGLKIEIDNDLVLCGVTGDMWENSKKVDFNLTLFSRVLGSLFGACLFFVITNFGVWSLGSYEYNINGLINCYTLALPFFTYNLISTLIFAAIIETLYKIMLLKKISILNKN